MLQRPEQIYGLLSGGIGQQDIFVDDFDSGGSSTGTAAIPTATTFSRGWRCLTQNSGALAYTTTDVDATTHGVLEAQTITAANATSGAGRFPSGGNFGHRVIGGGQRFRCQWRHRNLTALSDGTNRYTNFYGMLDVLSGTPTNGIYFTYSDNINGGQWRGVAMKAGVATNVDSAIAVAINTPYSLEWQWDSLNVRFLVNNVSIGTIAAANLPVLPISEGFSMIRNLGTADRRLRVDWYMHNLQWGTGR